MNQSEDKDEALELGLLRGKVPPWALQIFRDGKWNLCQSRNSVEEDGYDITEDEAREMIEKAGGSLGDEDDAPVGGLSKLARVRRRAAVRTMFTGSPTTRLAASFEKGNPIVFF